MQKIIRVTAGLMQKKLQQTKEFNHLETHQKAGVISMIALWKLRNVNFSKGTVLW